MSFSKTLLSVQSRKIHPDMTENFFDWDVENQSKQIQLSFVISDVFSGKDSHSYDSFIFSLAQKNMYFTDWVLYKTCKL